LNISFSSKALQNERDTEYHSRTNYLNSIDNHLFQSLNDSNSNNNNSDRGNIISNDDVYTQRRSRISSFIDPFERSLDTTTLPASTNNKDQKNTLKSDSSATVITAESCMSNNTHVSTTSPMNSAFDEEYAFFEEERRREKTGIFYFILLM
jgi:hypothetical protein